MKPELPDPVAAMALCTHIQVTAPASITQRLRLVNVDLCAKQTEREAAELADAFGEVNRKVKLLNMWKPQIPIWASCHTEQDFPFGVPLTLGKWSVRGKDKRVLPAALERKAFAPCIVCAFLSPQQNEDTSVS